MSAPKQLAKRQRLEKKRQRKQQTRLKRQNRRQAGSYQPDVFGPFDGLVGPARGLKMSEVLQDFVAPENDGIEGADAMGRLLSLGQIAWNAALEPKCSRQATINAAIDDLLSSQPFWMRQSARELVDRLVARKLQCFARYERPILAFQLDELKDGGYYLSVVSGMVF